MANRVIDADGLDWASIRSVVPLDQTLADSARLEMTSPFLGVT